MITIWKFEATPITEDIDISMPAGAEVLTLQLQHAVPCIWARVDTDAPKEIRRFHWRGTGHPSAGLGRFVGTIQSPSGELVFHLFEAKA